MNWENIQEVSGKEYKADNIEEDDYKVYFTSSDNMSEIPDNSAHMVFTSPPYFSMRGTIEYDEYADYLKEMYSILKEMYRVLDPGRVMMINISDYQLSEQLDEEVVRGTDLNLGQKYDCPSHFSYLLYKLNDQYAKHYELKYEDTIIWKKSGSTSQRAGTFVDSGNPLKYRPEEITERILVFRKGEMDYEKVWKDKRRSKMYDDVDLSTFEKFEEWASVKSPERYREYIQNVWEISPETSSEHPAPYPVELPKTAIALYTVPREIVVDPFLGSATTIKAAQELDRKSVGYENLEAEDEGDDFKSMIENRIGANSMSLDDF